MAERQRRPARGRRRRPRRDRPRRPRSGRARLDGRCRHAGTLRTDPGGHRGRLRRLLKPGPMRAVRLDAPGASLRVVEVPTPEPSGTEVRIRVAGCGVCHTDLHIVDGSQPRVEFPLILGHEVAGWVDALGPDADGRGDRRRGARVRRLGLRCCRECTSGAEQRCPNGRSPGFQADGGYAELMLVPHARHLVPLGSLDPVEAAPLGRCRPDPVPSRAARGAVAEARGAVLVIGAGGLGQFAIQYLRPPRCRSRSGRRGRRAVGGSAGARDRARCGYGDLLRRPTLPRSADRPT